ncbi:expressed unknown protein [Ectocarpus siliculosus]|uniref:Uncharacterized protein n=1 Tax=Ectocarpus siliculosus TaxID=2880 RepID=D7G307_ECTSI|nr:expressed unknown protein [Ectocarpus siliculosus]|eukprot:CBJ48864.1 expressed unknown protein [Ectocarpus siliculosus]
MFPENLPFEPFTWSNKDRTQAVVPRLPAAYNQRELGPAGNLALFRLGGY